MLLMILPISNNNYYKSAAHLIHKAKVKKGTNLVLIIDRYRLLTVQGELFSIIYPNRISKLRQVYFGCAVFILSLLTIYLANYPFLLATVQNHNTTQTSDANATVNDIFGIAKIYPTKENGREWYLNMNNPLNDSLFSITFEPNLTRQNDGSWRISDTNSSYSNPQIRMNIDTPKGLESWRDVEMTGYIKIVSINPSSSNITDSINNTRNDSILTGESLPPLAAESEIEDVAWYARGGKRNDEVPCEGTAYIGILHPDGTGSWKKSIWWTGGYSEDRMHHTVLNEEMIGKWIGWKVVMYNIEVNNTSGVKMESYIDIDNDGNWTKVTDLIDSGGWYARTSDAEFYSANCGKTKDYVVINSGPIATFRADNMVLDFKNLSIREIQPSVNRTLTSVNPL
jgi:hypothetical protein